jgi:hypothetical protein
MKKSKLKMGQGKVVTGASFWDREAEKRLFIERLDEGAHQLLVAQRRMGKTSLMAEVADEVSDRYICLFVDLQKCCSEPDAIVELSVKVQPHKGLWQKGRTVFGNVLDGVADRIDRLQVGDLGVTLRSGLTTANWRQKGDALLKVLADSDEPVVLLFDEVPILVNRLLKGEENKLTAQGKRQADAFMSWLRDNSIRHQHKIRMVLSGSIGLAPVLHQARLSATINNFVPLEIGPWDDEIAIGCINALAAEYNLELEDNVPQVMVDRLGCCIPHHVQMFFSHVHERCLKRNIMRCTVDDAEAIYKNNMLGVRGHVEMVHYEERLEQVLDNESCAFALDMLTEAAVVGRLTTKALAAFQEEYTSLGTDVTALQKDILWVLEHDGYLKKDRSAYVFVSKLIREWWKNRHRQFYTPVLKRDPRP